MSKQEQIKLDMRKAMKGDDPEVTSALRVVVGELERQPKSELSDVEVDKILRKLAKSEQETLEKLGTKTSTYLEVVNGYLPQMATEDEIKAWIEQNVDFDSFKNKMQAMKPIMAHFGTRADGKTVKAILLSM